MLCYDREVELLVIIQKQTYFFKIDVEQQTIMNPINILKIKIFLDAEDFTIHLR